ncbi:DUF229 domain-containing protein [Prolixibacteraceae bacterium JC049]|nr:DUF229 domain-containing protein [Prolixibacteraceae bacterium JC049]
MFLFHLSSIAHNKGENRPNVLFVISDDQSFEHTSFNGCSFIETPAFDKIASEGIYFTNCIAGSPGCAPSRSTIVTGRFHWQNEEAGQHASHWPKKFVSMVDEFQRSGYQLGRAGKGVGPFKYGEPFRNKDAAGNADDTNQYGKNNEDVRIAKGISRKNYAANFKRFMENRDEKQPFFFWFGAHEPHRAFEKGSWKRLGKQLKDVKVPGFLPDTDVIRGDLLDYAVEIEWFDSHLQKMLDLLKEKGELDNTIVVVTSDNGMAFPRAKANCYEYGVHVPFAIRYPKTFTGKRKVDNVISFADIAPTLFSVCDITPKKMLPMSGDNILPLLKSKKEGLIKSGRKYVFSGRERHSCSRYRNWGYPQRAIRDNSFLLIWNLHSERWPAGAPQRLVNKESKECHPMYGMDDSGRHISEWAFTDVDAAPSKSEIVEKRKMFPEYFNWSYGKRGEFELYDIENDPYCLKNLAVDVKYKKEMQRLKKALLKKLKATRDPRIVGKDKEVFDSYPRYSHMRYFPKP